MSDQQPATPRQKLYISHLLSIINQTLQGWCGYQFHNLTYQQANYIIPILIEDKNIFLKQE